jgi:hypothetical protein
MQNSTLSVWGSTTSQFLCLVPCPVVSSVVVRPMPWASRKSVAVKCGCSSGSPPLQVKPPSEDFK